MQHPKIRNLLRIVETPRFCGCLRETHRSSCLILQDCRRLNATSEERLINQCFECLALASLVWRIVGVGLREGTKFFRLFSTSGVSLWPIFLDSLRGIVLEVRKCVGHCAWYSGIYIPWICIREARLGTWKHIHELEWACELECRACLSDAVKAYAGHQTAPVVVNFVTTWLPVVVARLFMWSEGSFARQKKRFKRGNSLES